MRERFLSLLLVALSLLPSIAGAEGVAPTDDRGVAIPVAAPQRVVSLYGSYAEAWVGAGRHARGCDRRCRQRARMDLGDAQVIGTTKAPNLELILALDPDLAILSLDIAAQASAAEVLEAAGVPCAAFRVDSWQDYARMMDTFTTLTGRRTSMRPSSRPWKRPSPRPSPTHRRSKRRHGAAFARLLHGRQGQGRRQPRRRDA